MQEGSTIDLSERTAALPLVSAFTNTDSDRTLKFADGATVYVALGGKRFAGGKVISWDNLVNALAARCTSGAGGSPGRLAPPVATGSLPTRATNQTATIFKMRPP